VRTFGNVLCLSVLFSGGVFSSPGVRAGGGETAAGEALSLEQGFRRPPRWASIVPFWSWNGRLEPAELKRQIDEMADKGVYAAFMHARAGIDLDSTPYFSEGWWKAVETAVSHGKRVGFKTWIYDEDKWPSGEAGGRTLARDPERNSRKGVSWTEKRVRGPEKIEVDFPGAQWVAAARLTGPNAIDLTSLVDITSFNRSFDRKIDTAGTRGLRVMIVYAGDSCLLASRVRELGCLASPVRLDDVARIDLSNTDVLISDVGTEGTGIAPETLRSWIRKGGGYIDFTYSEPTAGLYDLTMHVTEDSPEHKWLLPDHPIASVPNPNPDSQYTGRRWSDQWWRGGADFDKFDHVLADPRWDPPGVTILARREGKGRVVYSGATQACRERVPYLELLQNLIVYAAGRENSVKAARVVFREEKREPWVCPEGEWILLGFAVHSYDGVDYLNPRTVGDFIDITHEAYARRVGSEFGKTIPGVFFDEIHNSGAPIVWTEGFAESFEKLKGYDIRPFLPVLFLDAGPATPVIRCDYYEVYTTLYENAWFKQISGWCERHDLDLVGHTIENINGYKTQGDYFRTIRHLQIPCTDNEDFRYRYPRRLDPWKPKQLASIAHLYGKRHAAVEAMGGAGWSFTLDLARYGHNLLAAHGINFFITHLFHYAEDRPENVDDWPNSWFFRNPYWKYFKTFADHSSRLSFLLTGGRRIVDVAVLYPQSNLWAGYGGGTTVETVSRLVRVPVDVDLIDPDSLLRSRVRNGTLSVSDMRYRVLVVPALKCLGRSEAAKIEEFLRVGGLVIVEGMWPTDSKEGGRGDPRIADFVKKLSERGIAPTPPERTPEFISGKLERDLIVVGVGESPLRYQHVRRKRKDIYWIANDERKGGAWRISFRALGRPSLWQPEDGSIEPVTAFVRRGRRTELDLELDGRQGCFVVFDRTSPPPPEGGVRVLSANLRDVRILKKEKGVYGVEGLLPAGSAQAEAELEIVTGSGSRRKRTAARVGPVPRSIDLKGGWKFLPVGEALDGVWRCNVSQSELELPVMKIRWERGGVGNPAGRQLPSFDDRRWREVKIFDSLHPEKGALRYLSKWEARFISIYDYRDFRTRIGGKDLACRKTILVPSSGADGWVCVISRSPFTLKVGEKEFKGAGRGTPELFEIKGLGGGKRGISVLAQNVAALLIEGRLRSPEGETVHIFSDPTWEVSLGGGGWKRAWEYVAPPEKPYGEPPYPAPAPKPHVVWYRRALPPGVYAILEPEVEGRWRAWIDGRELPFQNGEARVATSGVLAMRVELGPGDHGLIRPVRVKLRAAETSLGSWTDLNLEWYSGRAIYSRSFSLSRSCLEEDIRLELDLGRIAWFCEVWVNGRLAGTRIWPPYRLDITDYVKEGENRLQVVVANLLANRMRWDIFDDVKGTKWNRKWHDGNIMRDEWCLQSGLLGPVTLTPYRRVRVEP